MSATPPGYAIERARPEHLAPLPEIERRAGLLFLGHGVPETVLADATCEADFRAAQEDGQLWIALSPEGRPVGFALVEVLDGAAHLEELDVDPEHARRGLGAALVETVCRYAAERGLLAVTLTTFRDIPWNAPFYERLGFRVLAADALSPELTRLQRQEAGRGLEPERRVVMRREVGPAPRRERA